MVTEIAVLPTYLGSARNTRAMSEYIDGTNVLGYQKNNITC